MTLFLRGLSMRAILLITLCFVSMAIGADYERENAWADEIVPSLVIGDPVYLQAANGRKFLNLFTEAAKVKAAVVVVHGRGIHPDWGLIGVLRTKLADQGYTTLSVQIMVPQADHFFKGQDVNLMKYVKRFLDKSLKQQ